MRALRIFYLHKHLFNPSIPKSISHPRFSRYLHFTFSLGRAEQSSSLSDSEPTSETNPRGWSIYGHFGAGDTVRNKKNSKGKVSWVCTECGHSDGQWWGSCRECNAVGTVKRFSEGVSEASVSEAASRPWLPQQAREVRPLRLTDVNRGVNQLEWRIPL